MYFLRLKMNPRSINRLMASKRNVTSTEGEKPAKRAASEATAANPPAAADTAETTTPLLPRIPDPDRHVRLSALMPPHPVYAPGPPNTEYVFYRFNLAAGEHGASYVLPGNQSM